MGACETFVIFGTCDFKRIEAINAKLVTWPNIHLYVLKINEPCFVSFLVLFAFCSLYMCRLLPAISGHFLRQGISLHVTSWR